MGDQDSNELESSSQFIQPAQAARELLSQAEQQLKAARAQYESAQATHDSAKVLYESLSISPPINVSSLPTGSSSFCEDCSKIPLDVLFQTWPKIKPARRRVGDLFQAVERQSWCSFCKFLIEAFQLGDELHSERLALSLKARDSAIYFAIDPDGLPWYRRAALDIDQPSCPFFWLQTGMPTLTGIPHICITLEDDRPRSNQVWPRRRDALEAFNGSMNYDLIKEWLERCTTRHADKCSKATKMLLAPLEIDLIDVHTRKIVRKSTSERYIALSYVWGKGSELRLRTSDMQDTEKKESPASTQERPKRKRSQLPSFIPQTMEDAMIFTRRLGEQYLWIDLFCIDQNDQEQMRQQIDAMHNIFSSAFLTLLNVDGEDADWGLPGVSRPMLQTSQPSVQTSHGTITASFLYSIWHNNGSTVHDTRAWTLQERLLSPRAMVFAKTYLAMICQEEYFHDILDVQPDVATRMGDDFFREDGADIRLNDPEFDFKTYDALISVYSGRKLTVEADALNACLGSLNRIANSTGYTFTYGHPEEDLVRSLLWKPHHEHVLTRRSEFPSWSWLGWRGRTEFPYWVGDMADYANDSPAAPSVKGSDSSASEASDEDIHDSAKSESRPPAKRRRLRWFTFEDSMTQVQHETSCSLMPVETDEKLVTRSHYSHNLVLDTLVAEFFCRLIRHAGSQHKYLPGSSQQARTAVGDHWALLAPKPFDDELEVIRNSTGEHPAFESTDVWFRVDAATSALLEQREGLVKLAFLQQWPRIRDSKASNKWRWDMVSALVLLPLDDHETLVKQEDDVEDFEDHGTMAIRLAAVLLDKDDWLASRPVMGKVTVL